MSINSGTQIIQHILRSAIMRFLFSFIMLLSICNTTFAAEMITVSKSITIQTDIQRVWKWIGGFCAIQAWHPAVEKCEITTNNNAEFRLLTLGDGAQIKEQYTGGQVYGYRYIITESPLPVKDYSAIFKAEKSTDGVKLTWSAEFLAHNQPDTEAEAVIAGIFDSGLAAIKDKIQARKDKRKKHENHTD